MGARHFGKATKRMSAIAALLSLTTAAVAGCGSQPTAAKSSSQSGSASAAAANPLKGKTVTMVIPHGVGGGFDFVARLVIPYIEKYAGVSTVVPKNVKGGGGVVGDNAIATAAPNGLTIGICDPDVMAENFDGHQPGIKYDPSKMTWLAGATSTSNVLVLSKKSPYGSGKIPAGATVTIGAASSGDDLADAYLMTQALGAKVKLVTGYAGGTSQMIPMLATGKPDGFILDGDSANLAIKDGNAIPIMQINQNHHASLANIPTLLSKLPKSNQYYNAAVATTNVETADKAFCAAPGLSAAATQEWRSTFQKIFTDKAFLAKMSKRLAPSYMPGAEMQTHEVTAVKDGAALKPVVELVNKMVGQ